MPCFHCDWQRLSFTPGYWRAVCDECRNPPEPERIAQLRRLGYRVTLKIMVCHLALQARPIFRASDLAPTIKEIYGYSTVRRALQGVTQELCRNKTLFRKKGEGRAGWWEFTPSDELLQRLHREQQEAGIKCRSTD